MQNRRTALVLVAMLVLGACAPYRIDYKHLVFDETPGLQILVRSDPKIHAETPPLTHAKFGMPLEATLKRPSYEIDFDIPLNISPVLFLRVRSPQGGVLIAKGAHLYRVHADAEVHGYPYSFHILEADGAPLDIVIVTDDGVELGRERVTYRLRSRGVAYGTDWL